MAAQGPVGTGDTLAFNDRVGVLFSSSLKDGHNEDSNVRYAIWNQDAWRSAFGAWEDGNLFAPRVLSRLNAGLHSVAQALSHRHFMRPAVDLWCRQSVLPPLHDRRENGGGDLDGQRDCDLSD